MYTPNEIMFPAYAIESVEHARGEAWRKLINHLVSLPETHHEVLAFMLTMIRINGCMECETDSYRAMRGCSACAVQTLRRSKITEDELLDIYDRALEDMHNYLKKSGRYPDLADLLMDS